ncbi:hypothetical protein JI75_02525 [Berryella intestinalis]|uniref:Protein CopB n=1 Tax=Berryella intestinalis TaxID=1531429 RepID=A0A0A8B4H4_9ACTN|nr:hypothetical protein [Berryella intestinalis]AJC11713.1 hypothetical protein JI75_02525 [Berryella intestinalis]
MAVSEAQKRAAAKYAREKTKTITLRLYPGDADILEHLGTQENKQGYLKRLIREDMEREA